MLAISASTGQTLLMLSGHVDQSNCAEMQLWLEEHAAARVVLDLGYVLTLAVCGARRLADARDALHRSGQSLRIVITDDSVVSRVLRRVGQFETYESVTHAWETW